MMTRITEQEPTTAEHAGWWWKTLIGGAVLWLVTAYVTLATGNTNLVPTVILLGSFLVPFAVALFAAERVVGRLDALTLMMAFFIGGIFGVLGASILEVHLEPSWYVYFGVGFCEELVKAIVFIVVGWRIVPKSGYQGALLGATVGAGFAAFESAGYAFNAGLTDRGIDLISMLETEAVRAVLTPVGHVLWTAILGAAIFAVAAKAQAVGAPKTGYAPGWPMVLAFLAVIVLHALWDSMSFIAALIAVAITGSARDALQYGQLPSAQLDEISQLSTIFYVVGLAVISVLGVLLLRVWAKRTAVKTSA